MKKREISTVSESRKKLVKARRWVVKIGSALLTHPQAGLNTEVIVHLVDQIVALKKQGIKFVTPEPEELALWKTLAEQSVESLVTKGALSQAGVDRVMAHLRDYRNGQ